MKKIIQSAYDALSSNNQYGSLFIALTIPDICVALEQGGSSGERYSAWFENNLIDYKNFLSGKDCYALRCALLHQGKADISDQSKKDILEHVVFMEPQSTTHRVLFKNVSINGNEKSFLQLNVSMFVVDICKAAEAWLKSKINDEKIQGRVKETIEIHKVGYRYMNAIQFN